jgi:hypothetical protein
MSIFDPPPQPTVGQGALRIKRSLAQAIQQLETSLEQVRQTVQRHGASNMQTALGGDWNQVVNVYQALKQVVEQHKPGTSVPGMPQ